MDACKIDDVWSIKLPKVLFPVIYVSYVDFMVYFRKKRTETKKLIKSTFGSKQASTEFPKCQIISIGSDNCSMSSSEHLMNERQVD